MKPRSNLHQQPRGPQPRGLCPTCERSISLLANGTPRAHRNTNGDSCEAGIRRGACGTCGRVTTLYRDGTVRPHKQLRVRAARKPAADGWLPERVAETYSSKLDCPGAGEPAEAVESPVDKRRSTPMDAERWPTAEELNAERFGTGALPAPD